MAAGSRSAQAQVQSEAQVQPQIQPAAAALPTFFLKDGKLALNADGSRYVKFTLLNQAWARFNQSNPGTTINGTLKPHTTDFGIRRFRVQMFGQLTDRVFIYSQFGQNNFNSLSARKAEFFLHDATGEYAVVRNKLALGLGLSAWNGLSRFTSSSTGSIVGLDLPLGAETVIDVEDQFGRKLGAYAKGKLGKLDYRLSVADPLAFQRSPAYSNGINPVANFSSKPAKLMTQGYFMWQFLDQEANLTPYTNGTYLGKKRVLNLGAGFIVQPSAMAYRAANGRDTLYNALKQFGVDAYYDAPLDTARGAAAISAYASVMHLDFGPNYVRNAAPMNPANGTRTAQVLNGGGNGWPAYGTGTTFYAQVGYKLKDNLVGSTTFMPYASLQHARYERLHGAMNYYDVGVNWLLAGHTSKLTLAYQNRPIFTLQSDGKAARTSDRSTVVAQYQVFFN
ncbi:hypothetical protein GCM10027048_28280 [Hymenobacter coalescens]